MTQRKPYDAYLALWLMLSACTAPDSESPLYHTLPAEDVNNLWRHVSSEHYRDALKIRVAVHGELSRRTGRTHWTIAGLCRRVGTLEEATSHLRKADTAYRAVLPEEHPKIERIGAQLEALRAMKVE